jgi:hypothetical protein
VDVRLERQQEGGDVRLVEDRHVVNAADRRYDFRAIGGRQNGTSGSLQIRNGAIAVDGYHEAIRLARGCLKVPHVADVQEIEAAVRKGNAASGRAIRANAFEQLPARKNYAHAGSAPMACRTSSALTVAVPRFMTTRPPA